MRFGHGLRILRSAAGLGLREFARKVNLSPTYLSQIETGKLPPPADACLARFAEALGVEEDDLFNMSARPHPEVVAYLTRIPEAVDFLRAARKAGVEGRHFRLLIQLLGRGDAAAFAAALRPVEVEEGRCETLLASILDERLVFPHLDVRHKEELFSVLARRVCRAHPEMERAELQRRLWERERDASTGVGEGVAIPHAVYPGIAGDVGAVVRLARPVDYGSVDGLPVRMVFLLLGRPDSPTRHLRILSRVARLVTQTDLMRRLERIRTRRSLYREVLRADQDIPAVPEEQVLRT